MHLHSSMPSMLTLINGRTIMEKEVVVVVYSSTL